MSDFSCPVVRIDSIEKHPNADTLSITEAEGCPVIIRTTDFKVGDLAVYIPIESLIPEGLEWVKTYCSHLTFKNGVHRLKAVRLRKIFSMGMLVPAAVLQVADPSIREMGDSFLEDFIGDDVSSKLNITKYEEPEEFVRLPGAPHRTFVGCLPAPFRWVVLKVMRFFGIGEGRRPKPRLFPVYDVGHFRKSPNAIKDGEEVVVTEKIHGQNLAVCYSSAKNSLIVSSHNVIRGVEDDSNWWRVAREQELHDLKDYPDLVFYGEIYGHGVQDLAYGVPQGKLHVQFFDIWDTKAGEFLPYDEATKILTDLRLVPVPVLYRGPMEQEKVRALRDGKTTLGGSHIREGVVIRRAVGQRCVLKLIGDQYLLRKDGTEFH